MLGVDDVVARFEVLEEPGAGALARAGTAVGPATAGEVALGDDRQAGRRQRHAGVQRGGHHVAAGAREVAAGAPVDGQVEAVVAQEGGEAIGGALAVGGHDDAVPVGEQLGQPAHQPGPVADHGTPARCLDDGRVG